MKTKLEATIEKPVLTQPNVQVIIDSIGFLNKEGQRIYQQNIGGILGDKTTQQLAQRLTYKAWLLEMIFNDCKSICNRESSPKLTTGKTYSHVWVQQNNERILYIKTLTRKSFEHYG